KVSWTPIGTLTNPFTGSFNGNSKTIANLSLNLPSDENVGLFGVIVGALIQDLTLRDFTVIGADYVGALVGRDYGGAVTIKNINATGLTVEGVNNVGGLLAHYYGNGGPSLYNHLNLQDLNVKGVQSVGGVIGGDIDNTSAHHIYAEATV